ncbi:MAG TPA: polysaccharide biosynthesis/export family protein [Rhodoblastus sp.]|nr:polysaccharide biosynthesis/export family protein [Rhodoblastus sp.]
MIGVRSLKVALVLCVTLAVSGCLFIAKDGPETGALAIQASVTRKGDANPVNFALVSINPEAIRATNAATAAMAPRFGAMARGAGPDVSIGKGDIVSVTVFEGEAGGLFVPKEGGSRQGNYVQVPNQQVDARGQIAVPFVSDPIEVAGRATRDVSREISHRLASRAIEPQVVVSVVDKRGNDVSVLGDVNQPSKFSLDPGGSSLLAAIARAGGPKNPAYEETVLIQRHGRIHKAWMTSIVNDPKQNVPVRPGDVIYLAREPRVFMVFGATPTPGAIGGQNNRRFPFSSARMSLSEALATAGGLNSYRADPRQLFLFRFESREVLEKGGTDASHFPNATVPTVYAFDMSQGGTFFMADAFDMRDRDLIFISDATANDVQKVLNVVTSLSGSGYYASQMSLAAR